jgi:SpoVK/Ycf46/Vps4 family AAA+-type ATPase
MCIYTRILDYFAGALPAVAIATPSVEHLPAIESIVKALSTHDRLSTYPVYLWNLAEFKRVHRADQGGLIFQESDIDIPPGEVPLTILKAIDEYRGEAIFILQDLETLLTGKNRNPRVLRLFKQVVERLKRSPNRAILLCDRFDLPQDLEGIVYTFTDRLPDYEGVTAAISEQLADLRSAGRTVDIGRDSIPLPLIRACQGLTKTEIKDAIRLGTIVNGGIASEAIASTIQTKKIEKLERLGLSFAAPAPVAVGGLDPLKQWIEEAGKLFNSRDPNLPSPKGVALVGLPGCGKSLIAKTFSSLWNIPCLSFNLGSVLGSLVGQSESQMQHILEITESVAPIVLFIDELEKAFSGVTTENDGGVSRRIFGMFLSWLQDRKPGVFVVGTANNIRGLPPEFLRKGRWDEIFFVDLPTTAERVEILRSQLMRFKVELPEGAIAQIAKSTPNYSGADLEAIVSEAIKLSFFNGCYPAIKPVHFKSAIAASRQSVPAETVADLRRWASTSARLANTPDLEKNGRSNVHMI